MDVTKIWIVAVYFGKPPAIFPLFLQSCGWNRQLQFLLLVDFVVSESSIPPNVVVVKSSLQEVRAVLQNKLRCHISLSTPYKLTDYKPLYWTLLEEYTYEYDFWGFCDVDVILGDLSRFITPELLSQYDRIFGLGHLSLFRNCLVSRLAVKLPGSRATWTQVCTSESFFGFDEHHGTNAIWLANHLNFWEDESIAADILPGDGALRLASRGLNRRNQMFFLRSGRVFRGHFDSNNIWTEHEFAYIHLQKRAVTVNACIFHDLKAILHFLPDRVSCIDALPQSKADVESIVSIEEEGGIPQALRIVRDDLRYCKNRCMDACKHFRRTCVALFNILYPW